MTGLPTPQPVEKNRRQTATKVARRSNLPTVFERGDQRSPARDGDQRYRTRLAGATNVLQTEIALDARPLMCQ
jgi:hypothetical protein